LSAATCRPSPLVEWGIFVSGQKNGKKVKEKRRPCDRLS